MKCVIFNKKSVRVWTEDSIFIQMPILHWFPISLIISSLVRREVINEERIGYRIYNAIYMDYFPCLYSLEYENYGALILLGSVEVDRS